MAELAMDMSWEDEEAVEEFASALAKVQARRSTATPVAKPNDYARFAANMMARAGASKPAKRAPTEHAPSRESCTCCGIPGWKGCDHWLPCLDQPRHVEIADDDGRREAGKFHIGPYRREQRFTGKRRGIGASRL